MPSTRTLFEALWNAHNALTIALSTVSDTRHDGRRYSDRDCVRMALEASLDVLRHDPALNPGPRVPGQEFPHE